MWIHGICKGVDPDQDNGSGEGQGILNIRRFLTLEVQWCLKLKPLGTVSTVGNH